MANKNMPNLNDSGEMKAHVYQASDPSQEFNQQGNLYGSFNYATHQQDDAKTQFSTTAQNENVSLNSTQQTIIQSMQGSTNISNQFDSSTGQTNFFFDAPGNQTSLMMGAALQTPAESLAGLGSLGSIGVPATACGAGGSGSNGPDMRVALTAPSSSSNGPDNKNNPQDTSPPADDDNDNDNDNDGDGGGQLPLTPPTVTVQDTSGSENMGIILAISIIADPAGSTTLVISNLPPGSSLSAGVANGDGSYTLTLPQLAGLMLLPPLYFSGAIELSVTATTLADNVASITTAELAVMVEGVATAPILATQPASGMADMMVSLDITAMLLDNDGSETLSIIIGNVPLGATLSAGINNGDGTWTLTPAQLDGLAILPPPYTSGTIHLSVTAISEENGTTASTVAALPVTLTRCGIGTAAGRCGSKR